MIAYRTRSIFLFSFYSFFLRIIMHNFCSLQFLFVAWYYSQHFTEINWRLKRTLKIEDNFGIDVSSYFARSLGDRLCRNYSQRWTFICFSSTRQGILSILRILSSRPILALSCVFNVEHLWLEQWISSMQVGNFLLTLNFYLIFDIP